MKYEMLRWYWFVSSYVDALYHSIIIQLPMGSAVQRMAMQCWCLHFQSQDHSFLLTSNMFSNISKALSGTEDGEGSGTGNSEKRTKGDKVHINYWDNFGSLLSPYV